MLDDEIGRCAEDFTHERNRDMLDIDAWLERLHLEMTKYAIMQRMFIQIKKRLGAFRLDSVTDLIKHYKVEVIEGRRVRGSDFLKILGRIGVIRNHMADDIEYILDEYQHIDEAEYQA